MLVNDDTIRVRGQVVEILPRSVFRVQLANGHALFAHLPRRQKARAAELAVGSEVQLELSHYDLSRGRIALSPGPVA